MCFSGDMDDMIDDDEDDGLDPNTPQKVVREKERRQANNARER